MEINNIDLREIEMYKTPYDEISGFSIVMFSYFKKLFDYLFEQCKCEYAAIYGIIWYSRMVNNVKQWTYSIYNSSDCMRHSCDTLNNQCINFCAYIFQQRIEPTQDAWFCVSNITSEIYENQHSYVYNTNYHFFNRLSSPELFESNYELIRIISKKFQMLIKNVIENNITENDYHQLFIMKYKINDTSNIYLCKNFQNHKQNQEQEQEKTETYKIYKPSNVRFITVEYENPRMETRIELHVGREWMMDGNDLFMPAHIMHLLEHQPEPYVFDFEYKLHIMDNNINMFEIDINHHIYLTENNYKIIRSYDRDVGYYS